MKLGDFDVSRSDLGGSTPRRLVPTHLLQVCVNSMNSS